MYLSWDPSNLTQLCPRFLGLRYAVGQLKSKKEEVDILQIHFITIEIGIIGGGTGCQRVQGCDLHREVQTESCLSANILSKKRWTY